MQKYYITIIVALVALYSSCSNDISTIGQEIISSETYIGERIVNIDDMSTIKLDSFATSNGIHNTYSINFLTIGRYNDVNYGGTTTASAVFTVTPKNVPSLPTNAVLDSLIIPIDSTVTIWADTLYNIEEQTFYLYQLKSIPKIDYDNQGIYYNTQNLDLDSIIATAKFYPYKENLGFAYFKVDKALADTLFKRMYTRRADDEDIYNASGSADGTPYLNFLNFFKGLAIVPDDNNQAIINLNSATSLKMEMHYSVDENRLTVDFPMNAMYYKYNRIVNEPITALQDLNKGQTHEVSFDSAGFSMIQGMSGYMTKLTLPESEGFHIYNTVIKAQVELKVEYYSDMIMPPPSTIVVYKTDDVNQITSQLLNNGATPITGTLNINALDNNDTKYIFDITELYEEMSTNGEGEDGTDIILSIMNDGVFNRASSFDQIIIKEKPIIRVYYAKYK